MALNAWLTFSTHSSGQAPKFRLLYCEFGFNQAIDETGKPAARPKGGIIHMAIESTDNDIFVSWMISKEERKDGKIEFPLKSNRKKVVEFKEAVCIAYNEKYDVENPSSMVMRITLSANEIIVGSVGYSNKWKKND